MNGYKVAGFNSTLVLLIGKPKRNVFDLSCGFNSTLVLLIGYCYPLIVSRLISFNSTLVLLIAYNLGKRTFCQIVSIPLWYY